MTSPKISRRAVLRGLGTMVALPALESLTPARAFASTAAPTPSPLRMAFYYVPNGAHMAAWTPAAEGAEFTLPATLEPLAPFRDKLLVLSGLTHDKARPNGDGPGDHARALAAFLTASQPYKTSGANIRLGISVDQLAAQRVGHETRFPSLELGLEKGAQAGNCDSGYSCAYSSNVSWKSPTTPVAKEVDPRLVFERLFAGDEAGATNEARARRQKYQKSILDFVLADARSLQGGLGAADQRKLDEYLSSVREIEQRIGRAEQVAKVELPKIAQPEGIPQEYQDHARLMLDLQVLAFQGDVTRISTFMFANDGSNKNYPQIGVSDGHHDLSHHGRDAEKQAKIAKINRFHMEQFAYLVGKLKSIPEGDGTLLDHVMLCYGSGLSDGDAHNHNDLPVLLVGGGNGTLQPGRHVRYADNTPMANLFLSLLERMGASVERFGDSTGRLKGLEG
ncbi:MAG: DUF1552 domain-containing protein [Pirellulales bacterium]